MVSQIYLILSTELLASPSSVQSRNFFTLLVTFCLFMYLFCIPTYFGLHSNVHIIHSPKVAMIIAYTIFLFKLPLMLLIASSFLLLIMFIYELVELFSSFSYQGNLLFGLLPIGLCHFLCDDESL